MFKKYIIFFFITLLTSCSAPGTALLGPVFTGATTQSISRATLSYGTSHIARKIHINSLQKKTKSKKFVKKIEDLEIESSKILNFKFHQ